VDIHELPQQLILLIKSVVFILFAVLLGVAFTLVYVGVTLANVSFFGGVVMEDDSTVATPFMLAQVVAIFGAFGLAAGFSDRIEHNLRLDMRRIAVLHLVAAFSLCMVGLLLPLSPHLEEGEVSFWIVAISLIVFIIASAGCFAAGTTWWLFDIPKIIGRNAEGQEPTKPPLE